MFEGSGSTKLQDDLSAKSNDGIDLSVFDDIEDPTKGKDESDQQKGKTEAGTTPNFPIDKRFAHLPKVDAIARTAQSIVEKLKNELNSVHSKYEQNLNYVRAFENLTKNRDYRLAYLSKLDPDLVKVNPNTVKEQVKTKLKEEFKDFTPDPNEAGIYGSDTFEYNRRAAELEKEFSTKIPQVKDLDTLLAEVEEREKVGRAKMQNSLEQIKKEENWNDSDVEAMLRFFRTLDVFAMKKIYKFATKHSPKHFKVDDYSEHKSVAGEEAQKIFDLLGRPRSGPMTWGK